MVRGGTSSSTATRVRVAWFPILVSVENGVKELHIGWKYVDNSVGFYSNSANSSKNRPAWGRIINCKFKVIRMKEEDVNHVAFQNWKKEGKAFKLDDMNPSLWKVNLFTSKVVEMRMASRDEVLASYFSLLPKSTTFSEHKEGVHDTDGFCLDGTGVKLEDVVSKTGSLEEYREFVNKADLCCMDVSSLKEVMKNVEGAKKRKNDDTGGSSTVKRSKAERIEDAKENEVTDKDGIEQSYIGQYIGRADVPLHNLVNSPKVKLPINPFKVDGLCNKIFARIDPALLCLTVCPAEGSPFNPNNLKSNSFEVIHGRHRLCALKKLDEQGRLEGLVGMGKKMVTCHIVRTDCLISANYANLRGNDIQADYVRKPFLHELLYILEGLQEQYSKEKTIETIIRFGRLLEYAHDDLTALKKIGSWPTEGLNYLNSILKLYESFQTEDAKNLAKRHSSKIMKGSTIPIPHNLFRKIAKISPTYFMSMAPKIVDKELSLKQVAENFSKFSARSETMAYVVKHLPGHQTEQEVLVTYPTKFAYEVLDSFAGAVIGEKGSNCKGKALQDYCKGLVENSDSTPKAVMKEIEDFREFDFSKLPNADTVLVQCKKLTESQFQQLKAMKAERIAVNLVMLFSDQEEKKEVFRKLNDNLDNVKELFFEADAPKTKGDFCENLVMGILSAPVIFKPPLKSYNGPFSNLDCLVNQITPPGGKSVFVNDKSMIITGIHSTHSCVYYGEKNALDKLDLKLRAGVGVMLVEDGADDILENLDNSVGAVASGSRSEDGDDDLELEVIGDQEPEVVDVQETPFLDDQEPGVTDYTEFEDLDDSAIAGCNSWSDCMEAEADKLNLIENNKYSVWIQSRLVRVSNR